MRLLSELIYKEIIKQCEAIKVTMRQQVSI